MFRKNTAHLQGSLLSPVFMLSEQKRKKLLSSEEQSFYELIFCKIKEEDFECLYSGQESRPNAPINALVSSLILMNRKNWTYEQLFTEIDFNLLTRVALGLNTLDETPFCPASIFNFQNKINEYGVKTGINLFEKVFDHLTEQELKALKLKTNIQRTDSFLAASNIRNFSRLQLLVEILIRVYRTLTEPDQQNYREKFQEYTKSSSSQYLYHLERSDAPKKMEEIGQLYYWIARNLAPHYQGVEIFNIFALVYSQHFTVAAEKVTVVPPEQLKSTMVQSPDDLEATYRQKAGKESKGQSISVTETAHPDNALNLITDVAITSNTTDDSDILNSRLDKLKEKTPELEQLHMDGAYGSPDNDDKMKELKITPIQTAVKGRKQQVPIKINKIDATTYTVNCPQQAVKSILSNKRNKACFDAKVCAVCPQASACSAVLLKDERAYYFTAADYLKKRRHENINFIPDSYKNIRANVEATVCEFTNKFRKRKLKIRGFFKTTVFAYTVAVAVNFGRIYRYLLKNGQGQQPGPSLSLSLASLKAFICSFFSWFFKDLKTVNVFAT
jgi:IS5 family transposase